MNISDDMLTPEEREIARLLGRPDPAAGPSARVDADIMAMARASQAAAGTPLSALPQSTRPTRWGRRRRVFSSLAAAASLVLVVGLAWQLRPVTPPPPMQQESADEAAATAPVQAASADMQAIAEPDPASPAPAPMRSMAPPAPAPKPAAKAEPRPIARSAPAPAAAPAADALASPADQEVLDAPYTAATPVYAPAPPAPPAPVAAAPLTKTASGVQAKQAEAYSAEARERAMQFRALPPPPTDLAAASGNVVAEHMQQQQLIDVDADASLSRHKWLLKIRERRDNGDIEGARTSLRRFVQEYPEARIPRDLRPLLKD
ncbi:hypothetical protein ABB26_17735 [Stenotrophomonas humi]|uniref:Uncharacterized protein n=1 Tax=Stenotrophomonas humi TaxID=405444 RepID=A0A0R0BX71_9GAMM|nr:hypothetical protein [Stenotrophomonas humi]KRG61814.1 hypothetical protein ABB26_17735 [Stenotrophomonas humi]